MIKTKIILEIGIKTILFVLVCYFLFSILSKVGLQNFQSLFLNLDYLYIFFTLSLMPINWFLESFKWKLLVDKFENISISKAFSVVLKGLSIGFFTPLNVGDFTIRYLSLSQENSKNAFLLTTMVRYSQFLITILFGIFGLTTLVFQGNSILFFGLLILVFFVYFNIKSIFTYVKIDFFTKFINVINLYSQKDLFIILGISFIRYMVFSTQFILIFTAFSINFNIIEMYKSVFTIYFLKSIVPFVNMFGGLGLREISSVLVLKIFGIDELHAIVSSVTLWFINICIPTVFGLILLLKSKLIK